MAFSVFDLLLVIVHFLSYLISPSFLFIVRYFNYIALVNILESTFSYFNSGKQGFYSLHFVYEETKPQRVYVK